MLACLPDRIAGLDVRSELRQDPPAGVEIVFWDGEAEPPRRGEIAFLVVPLDLEVRAAIERMPRLEVLQTLSAGVDQIIDAVPEGVTLCDARGVHGSAVAEWVLAVTLAALRGLPKFVREQDRARWAPSSTEELHGKRALIVGAGDAGQNVARLFAACEADTILVARRARDGVHAREDLPSLLPSADVVVVVVPLTPATAGMVDAGFLAAMPEGALLVNAARGSVVNTDALVKEVMAGRLRAALDVTDPEPLPPEHPLWRAPGVLLTPHVAGGVTGFPARALALVRAQLGRHVRAEPLENVVSDGY